MEQDINLLLYRPLKEDKKLLALIPDGKCESSYLGEGMTDFSVEAMADWAQEYAWQMAEVAPFLEKRSLEGTCDAIHNFLFNNFQYHADTSDQLLRSPACAKTQRNEGIDCKSYSILASCLLLNLGINHYIRRTRQPGYEPDLWTHVYVVVPADQQTGKLDKGHYVIDGTVDYDEELYSEKSDTYMSGLKHYGLNGQRAGLNALDYQQMANYIFSGKLSLKNLSCIGGTLDSSDINYALPKIITGWEILISAVNNAIQSNSGDLLEKVNKVVLTAYKMKDHGDHNASWSGWKSSCSKDAAKAYQAATTHYYNIVNQAFLPWLKQFFNVTLKTVTVPNNDFPIETSYASGGQNIGFYKGSFNRNCTAQEVSSISMKSGVKEITRFEITPYIADAANYASGSLNTTQALSDFKNVLATFGIGTGGSSSGGGTIVPGGTIDNGYYDPGNAKTNGNGSNNTAIFVVSGIAVAGALAYYLITTKKAA